MAAVGSWVLHFALNYLLVAPLFSVLCAQSFKLAYYFLRERPFHCSHLWEAGGMPSSHAALVSGLITALGISRGWDSPFFVISLIFGMVVMYDSAGVRRAAGRQAALLNKICRQFQLESLSQESKLTEFVGHSPLEVFIGSCIGVSMATFIHLTGIFH